ncbi:MAG: prepilin peptidase CpaA [Burkholderiaceae bacterium]
MQSFPPGELGNATDYDRETYRQMSEHFITYYGQSKSDANTILLVLVLVMATATDLRSRRIPNWLVLFGLALSLWLKITAGDVSAWGLGLLIGFGSFIPLYALRAMGAGDVKLMAVVGAFLGPLSALGAVAATLLAGGVLAIVVALANGSLRRAIDNVKFMLTSLMVSGMQRTRMTVEVPTSSTGSVPYGAAIAVGTFATLWLEHTGHGMFR